ncbi:MAG TPA: hypothetical protein PKV98_07880 [Burkholderiaceae bacterium]|nr:hypothetical protein [Burkholderiaceae bacterium]
MTLPTPKDGDQLPTELGRPLPRPEPPKPGYTPTETPGVYKTPDGKLITAIPENERASWQTWDCAQDQKRKAREQQTIERWNRGELARKVCRPRYLAIGESCSVEETEDGLILVNPGEQFVTDPETGRPTRIA